MADPAVEGFVPSADERRRLVDTLLAVLSAGAAWHFAKGRLLEPSTSVFPEGWTNDRRGLRTTLRRLHRYAALPDAAQVTVHRPAPEDPPLPRQPDPLRGGAVAVWRRPDLDAGGVFAYEADGRALSDAALGQAACARAVASLWLAKHPVKIAGLPPAALTDVAAIALGFGVLIADASFYTARGTKSRPTRATALEPASVCYLLAILSKARRFGERAHKQVAGALAANQAAFYRASYDLLSRDQGEASRIEQIQLLLDQATTPPESMLASDLLGGALSGEDAHQEIDESDARSGIEAQARDPVVGVNASKPVFRVRGTMAARLGRAAMMLSFLVAGFVAGPAMTGSSVGTSMSLFGIVGMAVAALVGWFIADPRCSDPRCMTKLPAGLTECPRCKGRVVGDIANAKLRLAAEEDYYAAHPELTPAAPSGETSADAIR